MGSLRSLALLVWAFAQALLMPAVTANDSCVSLFNSNEAQVNGIADIVTVEIDVDEATAEQHVMYTLTWTDCVDPPKITDTTFNKYFIVNDTILCTWIVSVNTVLIGVPDYTPNPQNRIETQVTFEGFTDISIKTCQVTLTHNILDANTQTPEPDQSTYTLDINEDFMLHYTINHFRTAVHDRDGTSPNNKFTVITDDACPLEASNTSYTSGSSAADVSYQLRTSLDYEDLEKIVCHVQFRDSGKPVLTGKASITINVQDVPDQPPQFSEDYYYAEVTSLAASDKPLDMMPSNISAVDGDTAINLPISYSMTDVKVEVDGTSYFAINETTGEVTLIKDLDDTFLLNEQVMFFLTASDSSQTDNALLEVTLPPVPTTTTSTTTTTTTPATTCEPCTCPTPTTEEVTECPTQGTCAPCPTVTWGPDQPPLTFEQSSYAGDTYAQVDKVYQVKVKDIGYEVKYEWSEDSQGKQHFHMDPNSGWITIIKDNTPPEGYYQLQAVASIKIAPAEKATAQVNIHVLPIRSDTVVILNSVIRYTAMEGKSEEDVATFQLSKPAGSVCIIGVQPLSIQESFSLEKHDDTTWKLRKTGVLDYEKTQEITVVIDAFHESITCPKISDDIKPNLLRSQSMAIISVGNKNDEVPVFSSQDLVVAYPVNEGLRRAVGPVVSVQAEDKDSPKVTYSVTGDDADQFTVDEETGEVYVVKGLDCEPDCKFSVKASDGDNEALLNIKVLPLDMEQVFTLLMNKTVAEVDAALSKLSQEVEVQISKLYVSPTQPTTARRGRRHKRETQTSLEVHVYSIKDNSLMSRDELNSALEGESSYQAEEFMDAVVFEKEVDDNTGMTVAVAVLGSLLGLVLIVGIGFFIYKRKKGRSAPKQPLPTTPTPISTLGNAYQNHSYEKERPVMQGSLGHKTNGSLNGFTSVQVHSTQDRDSPPMHRSPLAPPSDSIPLRSMDNQQQQQGGLRRINPSAPEYYGSSTPAPPPSYTRTTASSITPEPSSSSSSFPIYAEIKKPKDPKPKSSASASTSSSSFRPDKNAPRSDFPATSIDKKPAVPNADYEEVSSTKFSSLKASPPPRRSNNRKADDDNDEDVKEGVAYPGGKNNKFTDEPAGQDERKSVAFKVMVDTKEIEAENMGPSQRKAEAEELMEANRKKIQEKGNEEDEDDEESAKL